MIIRNPLRDAQDEAPAQFCPKCGGEVWSGETLFEVDGQMVCSDCFEAWAKEFYNASPEMFAEALGVATEKVEV